jgi:hypothetical protein
MAGLGTITRSLWFGGLWTVGRSRMEELGTISGSGWKGGSVKMARVRGREI